MMIWTVLLHRCCAIALLAGAAAPLLAQDAASLQARHRELQHELADNPFRRPLHLESSETPERLEGDVYARLDRPYADVSRLLHGADRWCEIMILHINVKRCNASADTLPAPSVMNVTIGPKNDDPKDEGHDITFEYRIAASRPDYLQVVLSAEEGPLGTKDYHIVLEVAPLDRSRSFIHWSYAYGYGLAARAAMSAYLATIGRDKVGFSIDGRNDDGTPSYVRGLRGVIERNTMRYYLAIEAYVTETPAAAGTPDDEAVLRERRLRNWFAATERYPRQLHEVDLATYLEVKRRQMARRRGAPATRRKRTGALPATPPRPDGKDATAVDLTRHTPSGSGGAADADKSPRLPHERDESVGMTNRQPDARIKKGHDDVERGAQDTSRAPEADQTYRQLKQAQPKPPSNKR